MLYKGRQAKTLFNLMLNKKFYSVIHSDPIREFPFT